MAPKLKLFFSPPYIVDAKVIAHVESPAETDRTSHSERARNGFCQMMANGHDATSATCELFNATGCGFQCCATGMTSDVALGLARLRNELSFVVFSDFS
jgi:hypothetical protein